MLCSVLAHSYWTFLFQHSSKFYTYNNMYIVRNGKKSFHCGIEKIICAFFSIAHPTIFPKNAAPPHTYEYMRICAYMYRTYVIWTKPEALPMHMLFYFSHKRKIRFEYFSWIYLTIIFFSHRFAWKGTSFSLLEGSIRALIPRDLQCCAQLLMTR